MTSVQFKRGALIGLAVLFGGGVSGGAFAHEPDMTQAISIKVDYSDLDLATSEGASALYRRVSRAASVACQEPSPRELTRYAEFQLCFDETVAHAVARIDAPQLTALHRMKSNVRRAG